MVPPLQATPFPLREASPLSPAPGAGSAPIGGSPGCPAPPLPPHLCAPPPTCRVSLVDRPAVHLQGGVAATSSEAHHVVFAVAHDGVGLVDGNVVRAHVKDHPDGALVLGTGRQRSGVGRERPFTPARTPPVTTTGPALLRLTALQHTSPSPVLGPFTGPRGSACPLPHMRVREQLRFREVGEATVGCRAWTWSTSTDHTRFLLLASVKMFTNVYGAPTPCKGHCACRPQTGMIKSKPGPVGTPRVDSLRHDQQAGPQKPAWCLRRVWPPLTHTHRQAPASPPLNAQHWASPWGLVSRASAGISPCGSGLSVGAAPLQSRGQR